MIETIRERIAALPAPFQRIAERLLHVDVAIGRAIPPASMERWVEQQFGSVAAVRAQTIVTITNRLTLESALYNPLRALRPALSGGGDAALEAWIARELAEHDTFRDPERDTPADVFGRIRGRACITASNVAKYAGWHGLVIFDQPHPLRFGPAEIDDYLDTALRWIAAAHAQDAQAIYPLITWNCLPKSGATQMHGHMQLALAHGMPYARIEGQRRAAVAYRATTGASYFADLFALHQALGLAIPHAETRIFADLTPVRNREIVWFAEPSASGGDTETGKHGEDASLPPNLPGSLSRSIATILRQLIEQQGMRAFNLMIALPPLGPTSEDWRDMPIIARIADRGEPITSRSDIGAMELFAASVITVDPFAVVAQLSEVTLPQHVTQ